MSEDTVKPKKPYVTREQKEAFIQWYLSHYGYNVKLKENNSRVLSETYYQETGILIPKISIFRWLSKIEQGKVYDYAQKYIDSQLLLQ